ncbi:ATP-binding protein [Ramlibacter sp. XY19]|uniref:ATP-binding protein n=1 Tax=Ramlibacter paludis TaxID=2908000 RepID=UPI0023DACE17|nr:ATP-binding protein [Ramlibacter paludis]MCG2592334.1 ATP-binding protein [Ramlibacter paludis]
MRLTLQRKVFLALTLLLLLLLSLFVATSRLALQRGIGPYVAEIELSRLDWVAANLQQAYAKQGSWQFLKDDPQAWHAAQMLPGFPRNGFGPRREFAGGPHGDGPPQRRGPDERRGPPLLAPQMDVLPQRYMPPPPPGALDDPRSGPITVYHRLALLAADGRTVLAGKADVDLEDLVRKPLAHDGRTIGYLALAPLQGVGTRADEAFVARQSTYLLGTGLIGLVVALLISLALARRWLASLQSLAGAARAVADGKLNVRVPVEGDDELAQLTETFNTMAARLGAVEESRQHWLADIAHELRTPIAAMRAEIEALQDGVRSFDAHTASRLHAQVMRLGKLVEDLRQVMDETHAGAEQAQAEVRPLAALLEAVDQMEPRLQQGRIAVEGLEGLRALADQRDPVVRGDPTRLAQVFANLLENTARYTQAGGRLVLHADVEDKRLVITLDDTPPAPAAADLPRLFDRFFRGDASRDRATGGSGLGLSICRAIVEAHGGRIAAQPSPLGGLRITLELPLA